MGNQEKIVTREEAARRVSELKAAGKVVGYTSGVFDILHPGHVQYLEDARARCDFLVVGINSDLSVRTLKGPTRPICGENDRARVIAGLASVDLVFIFGEQNNNENIKALLPSVYLKAGDYSAEKLSSAPLVEAAGGRVELVPFMSGRSSTSIIEKIAHLADPAFAPETVVSPPEPAPAVFMDRDGTINVLHEYMSEVEKFELLPGVVEAMKVMQAAGYRLVVITNQPGAGLGYFTREDIYRINSRFLSLVVREGVKIDKIYICPHSEAEKCDCRKPKPTMINRAISELNIIRSESFMVGDMTSDILCGKNAGCRTALVQTGKGGSDKRNQVEPDFVGADLRAVAEWIVSQGRAAAGGTSV